MKSLGLGRLIIFKIFPIFEVIACTIVSSLRGEGVDPNLPHALTMTKVLVHGGGITVNQRMCD